MKFKVVSYKLYISYLLTSVSELAWFLKESVDSVYHLKFLGCHCHYSFDCIIVYNNYLLLSFIKITNKTAVRFKPRFSSQLLTLSNCAFVIVFVDALGKHPLCHRMCKVTKETSGANNIMRNAVDSTSITFRWTSSSSRQSVFSTTTIAKKTEENGSQLRRVIIWSKLGHGRQNLC